MSTIAPVLQNNNGINRSLLKNIKNNIPASTSNLKKSDVKSDTNNLTGSIKKTNLRTPSKASNNKTLLFTPSNSISLSKPKEENLVISEVSNSNNTSFDIGTFLEQQPHSLNIEDINCLVQKFDSILADENQISSPLKKGEFSSLVEAADHTNQDEVNAVAVKTTPSVVGSSKITYQIDFLLSMKSKFTTKPVEIDFVITNQSEIVVPSKPNTPYVQKQSQQTPSRSRQQQFTSPMTSPVYKQQQNRSTFNTPFQLPMVSPLTKTPIPFQLPTISQPTSSIKKSSSTPKNQILTGNKAPLKTPKSNKTTPIKLQEPFQMIQEETTSSTPTTVAIESIAKVDEAAANIISKKPRETDAKRLAARQRQIDIGKMTAGYKNFISTVPKSKRKQTDPKTPNKNQICSKRSWDGQVRKWRRLLHQYDPEAPKIDEEEMKQLTKVDEIDGEGEYLEDDDEEVVELVANNNDNTQQ